MFKSKSFNTQLIQPTIYCGWSMRLVTLRLVSTHHIMRQTDGLMLMVHSPHGAEAVPAPAEVFCFFLPPGPLPFVIGLFWALPVLPASLPHYCPFTCLTESCPIFLSPGDQPPKSRSGAVLVECREKCVGFMTKTNPSKWRPWFV